MPYTIYVTPTAAGDLAAAIEYYNSVSPELGYRFVEVIAQYFERIADIPTVCAVRYRNVRCRPVKKFPFIITFVIDEYQHAVHVLRIFNTYQDPRRM